MTAGHDAGSRPAVDPRVRLAAERTLLAWIRTGLAMMGFGFVVARFALWLRAVPMIASGGQSQQLQPPPSGHHLSVWFGTALVLLGVATNAIAARRHRRYVRALDAGDPDPALRASLPIAIANLLAAVGIAMAAYLAFEIM